MVYHEAKCRVSDRLPPRDWRFLQEGRWASGTLAGCWLTCGSRRMEITEGVVCALNYRPSDDIEPSFNMKMWTGGRFNGWFISAETDE